MRDIRGIRKNLMFIVVKWKMLPRKDVRQLNFCLERGKDLGDFLLLERNNTELLLKCESRGLTSVTSWGPNMAMLST